MRTTLLMHQVRVRRSAAKEFHVRTQVQILIAVVGLFGSISAKAESPAAATSAPDRDTAGLSATWVPRKLLSFTPPYSDACGDVGYDLLKYVLIQLGARESDLKIRRQDCQDGSGAQGLDATFSVLMPAEQSGKPDSDGVANAQWQTVELKVPINTAPGLLVERSGNSVHDDIHDCPYLRYATQKVLPLFSAREVKRIPDAICEKYGIGLRARLLKPTTQRLAELR
jgi:hypothetical protein